MWSELTPVRMTNIKGHLKSQFKVLQSIKNLCFILQFYFFKFLFAYIMKSNSDVKQGMTPENEVLRRIDFLIRAFGTKIDFRNPKWHFRWFIFTYNEHDKPFDENLSER